MPIAIFSPATWTSIPTSPPLLMDLLYDPQTSGGLLISLPPAEAGKLVTALRQEGNPDARIVGEVVRQPPRKNQDCLTPSEIHPRLAEIRPHAAPDLSCFYGNLCYTGAGPAR